MPDAVGLLLATLAALAGMGWLALSLDGHWKQVFAGVPRGRLGVDGLRLLGSGALGLSLLLCLWVDHPTMAVLVWVMLLGVAALVVALVLAWRARWLRGWYPGRG